MLLKLARVVYIEGSHAAPELKSRAALWRAFHTNDAAALSSQSQQQSQSQQVHRRSVVSREPGLDRLMQWLLGTLMPTDIQTATPPSATNQLRVLKGAVRCLAAMQRCGLGYEAGDDTLQNLLGALGHMLTWQYHESAGQQQPAQQHIQPAAAAAATARKPLGLSRTESTPTMPSSFAQPSQRRALLLTRTPSTAATQQQQQQQQAPRARVNPLLQRVVGSKRSTVVTASERRQQLQQRLGALKQAVCQLLLEVDDGAQTSRTVSVIVSFRRLCEQSDVRDPRLAAALCNAEDFVASNQVYKLYFLIIVCILTCRSPYNRAVSPSM